MRRCRADRPKKGCSVALNPSRFTWEMKSNKPAKPTAASSHPQPPTCTATYSSQKTSPLAVARVKASSDLVASSLWPLAQSLPPGPLAVSSASLEQDGVGVGRKPADVGGGGRDRHQVRHEEIHVHRGEGVARRVAPPVFPDRRTGGMLLTTMLGSAAFQKCELSDRQKFWLKLPASPRRWPRFSGTRCRIRVRGQSPRRRCPSRPSVRCGGQASCRPPASRRRCSGT